jgi:hypothetical protein
VSEPKTHLEELCHPTLWTSLHMRGWNGISIPPSPAYQRQLSVEIPLSSDWHSRYQQRGNIKLSKGPVVNDLPRQIKLCFNVRAPETNLSRPRLAEAEHESSKPLNKRPGKLPAGLWISLAEFTPQTSKR